MSEKCVAAGDRLFWRRFLFCCGYFLGLCDFVARRRLVLFLGRLSNKYDVLYFIYTGLLSFSHAFFMGPYKKRAAYTLLCAHTIRKGVRNG